jgi:hypothetical protein
MVVVLRSCSSSLVVMTSALHAEGREFNPRLEYITFCFVDNTQTEPITNENPG